MGYKETNENGGEKDRVWDGKERKMKEEERRTKERKRAGGETEKKN